MKTRNQLLSDVMQLAWQFVKTNFQKVDGSIREAYGTLADNIVPDVAQSGRRANDTVQTYYDTERRDFRCFKKANLISIA